MYKMLSNLAPRQLIAKGRPIYSASLSCHRAIYCIAFNQTINNHTDETTIVEALLMAPPFNLTFTNNLY